MDHGGRNPLQVSGQHDEINAVLLEQIEKLRPVIRGVEVSDIDGRGGGADECRRVRPIGCDEHHFRDPLTREIVEVVYDRLKIGATPRCEHGKS